MKAIVYHKYGSPDVFQLENVEKPTPKDNEVMIRVYATTASAGDCELRRFDISLLFWLPVRIIMGITGPRKKILGQELAGEIVAIGKNVTLFKKGDPIFAPTDMKFGAYAEYKCMMEKNPMAIKPINMSYDEAATIPTGGLNALHFLRKGNIKPGEKVLINGAGGSIGTCAVQIAKYMGAEVTCVDSNNKLDMLQSLGADHVIDYNEEDFTNKSETYDVIIDVIRTRSFLKTLKSLKKNGRYVLGNPSLSLMITGLWISITSRKKVINALAPYKSEDLIFLKNLIEHGKIKGVIDKCYPLEQMTEAHRYVESGQKTGNVVITI